MSAVALALSSAALIISPSLNYSGMFVLIIGRSSEKLHSVAAGSSTLPLPRPRHIVGTSCLNSPKLVVHKCVLRTSHAPDTCQEHPCRPFAYGRCGSTSQASSRCAKRLRRKERRGLYHLELPCTKKLYTDSKNWLCASSGLTPATCDMQTAILSMQPPWRMHETDKCIGSKRRLRADSPPIRRWRLC